MVLYDLLLIMVGIFIGVVAADPLKKLFTGGYKEEMRQKKRVKLLLYLREEAKNDKPTAEQLNQLVFKGKEKTETVLSLLKDIEETGLITNISSQSGEKRWYCTKKAYTQSRKA